ncbi:hypothetical protein C1H46_016669 [Malus baccata]|uniref:Uncharacterized protein n=1 Tax=Malus baccata TaxID=106549 RepID=A0A540MG22_MALBA|nr:hypothetical protein C1H46_016669 [Malus baccata]
MYAKPNSHDPINPSKPKTQYKNLINNFTKITENDQKQNKINPKVLNQNPSERKIFQQ